MSGTAGAVSTAHVAAIRMPHTHESADFGRTSVRVNKRVELGTGAKSHERVGLNQEQHSCKEEKERSATTRVQLITVLRFVKAMEQFIQQQFEWHGHGR